MEVRLLQLSEHLQGLVGKFPFPTNPVTAHLVHASSLFCLANSRKRSIPGQRHLSIRQCCWNRKIVLFWNLSHCLHEASPLAAEFFDRKFTKKEYVSFTHDRCLKKAGAPPQHKHSFSYRLANVLNIFSRQIFLSLRYNR
jgi:hypothetical protein